MNKLRIAIIGGGWFGQYHLQICSKEKDVEVVALACTNEKKSSCLKKQYPSVHYYSSQQQLFTKEEKIDALIVAVPPDSHNNIELEAAERKIPLFVEKPLGVDRTQVLKNQEVLMKSGVITSVGYHTRYSPTFNALKKYLQDKQVGLVNIKWIDTMPLTPWWRDKTRSGGQIVEQITHYIDAVRYLFGNITDVASFARNDLNKNYEGFNSDSASVSIFRFENGILGTLSAGCFKTSPDSIDTSLQIHTMDVMATYFWNDRVLIGKTSYPAVPVDIIYQSEMRSFFDAILTGNRNLIRCPYEEGVKTFLTTLGFEKSISLHQAVSI